MAEVASPSRQDTNFRKIGNPVFRTGFNALEQVLYLGPDYRNHRGGIAAVIDVYRQNIPGFRFIPTYSNRSRYHMIYYYFRSILLLIYTLITSRAIKIVHIHTSIKGSFMRKSILMLISKLFGRKTILHIHSGNFHTYYKNAGFLKPYIRRIVESADLVVCLSQHWKKYFSSTFSVRGIEVVNNATSEKTGNPSSSRRSKKTELLFLGKICENKGIFDLLRVLHTSRKFLSGKYRLIVAGNGETEKLKEQVKHYGLEEEVFYTGWATGKEKTRLLQQCDLFILPSHNEGLPVAVLEAMAHGKAVIATSVGGIPEVVLNDHNGWLLPAQNSCALEKALYEAIDNKDLLTQYGQRSLEISRNYTPEFVIDRLKNLYSQLLVQNL